MIQMTDYIIISLLAITVVLLISVLISESRSKLSKDDLDRAKSDILSSNDSVKNAVSNQRADILHEQLELQQRLNNTLSSNFAQLRESNDKQLETIRASVDEKLSATLSEKLDNSFKTVSDQLAMVYKALGEMNKLSSGVSDLQKLLTNVKARGTWAEVQLGEILSQTLTSDQYAQNVSVRNNSERVEYAIKIPSKSDDSTIIYLPIDSKFPQEDYLRICEAAENADKQSVEQFGKELERTVKSEAETINKLYINVPYTTDFAIMFLPTEGLYAEVIRRQGLVEEIQTKYRVMICGPMTITAFLNTIRMGFRTIALDRKASEVWKVLGAVKQQYDEFSVTLDKAKKKLEEAGNALDNAQRRNSIIKKKLKNVENMPKEDAEALLPDFIDFNSDTTA